MKKISIFSIQTFKYGLLKKERGRKGRIKFKYVFKFIRDFVPHAFCTERLFEGDIGLTNLAFAVVRTSYVRMRIAYSNIPTK